MTDGYFTTGIRFRKDVLDKVDREAQLHFRSRTDQLHSILTDYFEGKQFEKECERKLDELAEAVFILNKQLEVIIKIMGRTK